MTFYPQINDFKNVYLDIKNFSKNFVNLQCSKILNQTFFINGIFSKYCHMIFIYNFTQQKYNDEY